MKNTTQTRTTFLLAGALALAVTLLAANAGEKPKENKKGLLHFSIQKRMANEGALADANGKVDLHSDVHDKDNHQDVHLHLGGLDATATYQLAAQVDDDTNLTQVLTFTSDREGKADIHLREKGPKHPHDKDGHVDAQLPSELQPASLISQLIVTDTNGTAILTADLTAPDKFEYFAKLDLSSGDIRSKLEIKADGHKGHLKLDAKGLEAGSQYSLTLNGNVAGSDAADEHGNVHFKAELQNPADILALSSVAVLDASSNTVLSTTVP